MHLAATSPAGKASRHLSGCGSQPEPLQHAFSSFSASNRQQSAQNAEEQSQHALAKPSLGSKSLGPDVIPDDATATAQLRNLMTASLEPATVENDAGDNASDAQAATRLNNLMRASTKPEGAGVVTAQRGAESADAIEHSVPETPDPHGKLPPRESPFKVVAGHQPSMYDMDVEEPDAADGSAVVVQPGRHAADVLPANQQLGVGSARPSKRRASSHFEPLTKRPRSSDISTHTGMPHPHGMLGGLVNKLQMNRASTAALSGVSSDEDVDIDLDRVSKASGECNTDAEDDVFDTESSKISDPIAGLEHVQPFASIANLAVESIRAASLQKFGMTESARSKHGLNRPRKDVLQPFAPPRRKADHPKTTLAGQSAIAPQTLQHSAPSLQQFARTVTQNNN